MWEEILAAGGLPEPPDDDTEPTAAEAARAANFDRWQGQVFQESQGCLPLAVVAFSQVGNEIADFLADAGHQTSGLEDIRAFVTEGRRKAASIDIVCRADIVGDDIELTLYTEGGQFLDRLTMQASKLPVSAGQMPSLIGAFVRVVEDSP